MSTVLKPTPFIQVTVHQVKETKNMIRFEGSTDAEAAKSANVPYLYVRQTALAAAFGRFPKKIKITIEEVE